MMPAPTSLPTNVIAGQTGHISHSNTIHDRVNGWTTTPIQTKTANYTLVLADSGETIVMNSASATTVTVPTNATVAFPVGTVITIVRYGTGTVTIAGAGVTFRAAGSLSARVQYSIVEIMKYGTDEWIVSGDMG